ncbi:MAG: hypothetical protein JST70_12575 [Bacteroidetes bacterium]|nr:hypothetical protein [Bacteroidota bacterium]
MKSKKETQNSLIEKYVLLIVSVILFILVARYYGKDFRKSHKITVGYVFASSKGCGTRGNFGANIQYQYYADGRKHTASTRDGDLQCNAGKFIIGNFFPVAYKKYWYGYESQILLTPSEFEYYGYPFPDSLKWIISHVKTDK